MDLNLKNFWVNQKDFVKKAFKMKHPLNDLCYLLKWIYISKICFFFGKTVTHFLKDLFETFFSEVMKLSNVLISLGIVELENFVKDLFLSFPWMRSRHPLDKDINAAP